MELMTFNIIKTGEPNLNGQIYTKESIQNIINQKNIPVILNKKYFSNNNIIVPTDKIVGFCNYTTILNNSLDSSIQFNNTEIGKLAHDIIDNNKYELVPIGFGKCKNNIVDKNYKIIALTFIPKKVL